MPRLQFLPRLILNIAAAGGLTALLLTGAAQALTDTVFRYSAPKNGFYSIDRMAMTPANNDAANAFSIGTGDGLGLTTDVTHCFNSAVNLPNGATIVKMTVWFSSSAESNPEFFLLRQRLSDGISDVVAIKGSNDNSGMRKSLNANAVAQFDSVDNSQYSYGFGACIGQIDAFYAARIQYTYTDAGD